MFNKSPYNRAPYNRKARFIFEWTATASAESESGGALLIIRYLSGGAQAESGASGVIVRGKLFFGEATAIGEALGDYIRTLFFSGAAEAVTTSEGAGVSTYGQEVMTVAGVDMRPGDELIIDTEHMTVTLNGVLAALFSVPQCFDSEYIWTWDTTGYPWALSLTAPADELKSEIRYQKNMTGIHKTKDATGLANRIYALGYGEGVNQLTIASVNGGKPYVEDPLSIERYGLCSSILVDSRYIVAENLKAYAGQILKECAEPYICYEVSAIDLHRLTGDAFSRFRPGEIVRVVDEEDGINLRTRIVSVTKDDTLGDPGSISVTLANKAKDISGSISDLQSRALIGETYAQGSTNQQIYNFADNADSTHPATLKLYISDSVVRINKMLLNIQFEPFRAFEQSIEGGGGQTTSSGGGQTTSSGGGQTTSSGGGQTTSSGGGQTTSSGGGQTTSSGGGTNTTSSATPIESSNTEHDPYDDGGEGGANHNHGLSRGMRLAYYDQSNKIIGYRAFVPSGKHTHGQHSHTVKIGSHI